MKPYPDPAGLLQRLSTNSEPQPAATPTSPASPADADLLDAYSRAVIGVVDQISPAVVAIGAARNQDPRGGSGSGFLVTPDGYAITNSHVVNGRSRLSATTHEGDVIDAAVIGDDPATDLALVRIGSRDLPFSSLGDSDTLRVGQLVVAMGSPFGLQSTVSSGIVSAVGRSMRGAGGRLIEGVVQHTAPINPGNSGGPLLDSRGRVIGVNTAVIAFAQGVGFAVPSNTTKWVLTELITHGKVRRMVLGIAADVVAIPRRLVRELDLLNETGVRVASLDPKGPAARGNVREGDVIVALDGRIVANLDDLYRLLARRELARPATLTIIRENRRIELTLEA